MIQSQVCSVSYHLNRFLKETSYEIMVLIVIRRDNPLFQQHNYVIKTAPFTKYDPIFHVSHR